MARRSTQKAHQGREALKTFLAAESRPDGTLQYHQLQGFLFTVASSPELILPSEWMPLVFGEQEAGYRNVAEVQAFVGELMSVYNDINTGVAEGKPTVPLDCAFRDDVLENFKPDAPISQWSRGFVLGHGWLSDTWDSYLPEDEGDDEFGVLVLALSFFATRRLARAYSKELKLPQSLNATATTIRGLFPDALRQYARLGRMISAVLAEHENPKASAAHSPKKTRRAKSR